ncbi:hypothetical protein [Mesorhizobium sp.]|uniref:hypothetical protein n=1 Tax=Mesorhizobium sp. TaxID=1871066 RepID=UPI00120C5784|nr:hypothetical protein [Mesorhizobium sp.]TIO24008.1 MAG: hypothetical protein E5X83_18655 [Mesorhizobium sp.]
MGIPTEPLLDTMRRSMANLAFVEAHAGPVGPYEVTQLINTFLGALAHPFEAMRDDLMGLGLADAAAMGWPTINKERPSDSDPASLGDLIRLIRNGRGQIHALRVWNTQPRTQARTWGAVVPVAEIRRFLRLFVELIERRHKDFGWYERGAA